MLNARIFPNGEFSVWDEKKTVEVTPPPDQPDYMGLSLLANSHRVALGLAQPPPERAKRGSKGITRHGARTIRNAAFLLEQRYGRDRLSFLTVTLPGAKESDQYHAGLEWPEICRQFFQSLGRLLSAAGLPATFCACTEVQTERYERHGGLPLHLHVVFPGRKPFKSWAIATAQFDSLWRNAVLSRCPEFAEHSFASACQVQRVKKSAEGYLGKYMSKGADAVGRLLADDGGLIEFLPSTWWNCSLNLRRAIGRRITGGNTSGRALARDIRAGDTRIQFSKVIEVTIADGTSLPVAIVGRLSPEGRARYCWREGGVLGRGGDLD